MNISFVCQVHQQWIDGIANGMKTVKCFSSRAKTASSTRGLIFMRPRTGLCTHAFRLGGRIQQSSHEYNDKRSDNNQGWDISRPFMYRISRVFKLAHPIVLHTTHFSGNPRRPDVRDRQAILHGITQITKQYLSTE